MTKDVFASQKVLKKFPLAPADETVWSTHISIANCEGTNDWCTLSNAFV